MLLEALDRNIPGASDGKRTMEIGKWAGAATLDTFALTALNGTYNALEEPDSQRMKDMKLLLSPEKFIKYYKWALILPYTIWRWLPMKDRYALDAVIKDGRDTLKSFMEPEKRLQNPSMEKILTTQESSGSQTDIMARIMESGHSFTDEQMMDHIVT